jgi:ATP-dependent Clp protease protease subunit
MTKFWEFKALAEKRGELYLYGEISGTSWYKDDITPSHFIKDLAALGEIDVLDVYLNSPGGDAFAGIAIYHALKRHPATVNVHVDGIAASAASVVAMAGDRIVMPRAATMMIHQAWGVGMGGKTDLRALADELERLDGQLAGIYAARTGKDAAVISAWMQSERWMNGDEALADGFADEVEADRQIAACVDVEKLFARYLHPPWKEPEKEAEPTPKAAEQGGFSMPENGEVIPQPVSDKTTSPMTEQRRRFDKLKLKMLEV